MTTYPFLDDEEILIINRTLAKALGLTRSVLFRQVRYWIRINEKAKSERHFHDGCWWTYNTIEDWQQDNFDFWSENTIQRGLKSLEDEYHLLQSGNYNQRAGDQTKWYTLNYGAYLAFIALWQQHGSPVRGDNVLSVAYQAFLEDWVEQAKAYANCESCHTQFTMMVTPLPHDGVSVTRSSADIQDIKSTVDEKPSTVSAYTPNWERLPPPPLTPGVSEEKTPMPYYAANDPDLPEIGREILQFLPDRKTKRITKKQIEKLGEPVTNLNGQFGSPIVERRDFPNEWVLFLKGIPEMPAWKKRVVQDHTPITVSLVIEFFRGFDWKGGWLEYRPNPNKPSVKDLDPMKGFGKWLKPKA